MRIGRIIFVIGAASASLAVLLFAVQVPVFWAQWMGAMVLGFGLAWTTVQIHSMALKIVVAAVALIETAALSWLLQLNGINWPPQATLAAGAIAVFFGLLYSQSKAGRRRGTIERMLGGRVSRTTLKNILDSPVPLPVRGEKREASVVHCQIMNCPALAARISGSDFVKLSNAFCALVSQALVNSGGVLAESCGGQSRALFGAVLQDTGHEAHAHEAARAVEERLQVFRQTCRDRWDVSPDYRVAVHSGSMIVGVFGSTAHGGFDVVLMDK